MSSRGKVMVKFRKKPAGRLKSLITEYNTVIKIMDGDAKRSAAQNERAYGGELRAVKGKLLW